MRAKFGLVPTAVSKKLSFKFISRLYSGRGSDDFFKSHLAAIFGNLYLPCLLLLDTLYHLLTSFFSIHEFIQSLYISTCNNYAY